MKKRFFCILMMFVVLFQLVLIPAAAEETTGSGNDQTNTVTDNPSPSDPPAPSEDPKPSDPPVSSEESKPEESNPTYPTQGSTSAAPSEPKPCTHVFGDWTADEAAHGRKCTLCGHAESNSHSWAAETVTVDPTCGEAGGKCKVCTVCAGVLVTELIAPTGKHSFDNTCDTKCNVCGAQRTIEHTFGTGWKYSGKGHWHYCTICGAADTVLDHYPGPAATEEKEQICLTCGMVMMKKKAHTHKWDSTWSSDDSSHWYTCTVCKEKDKSAAHTYDDGCDTDCNVCGYVRTAAHTYGPDWTRTEQTHYGICTVCGDETPEENHIADSTGTACSVCGYAMEVVEETHVHEFDEDVWGFDENGHWNTCMCGEKDSSSAHTWDKGKEKGKQTLYTCEVCGAERTEDAPESGFPWLLLLAGGGILICLVGIVVCIVLIRRNREYDD